MRCSPKPTTRDYRSPDFPAACPPCGRYRRSPVRPNALGSAFEAGARSNPPELTARLPHYGRRDRRRLFTLGTTGRPSMPVDPIQTWFTRLWAPGHITRRCCAAERLLEAFLPLTMLARAIAGESSPLQSPDSNSIKTRCRCWRCSPTVAVSVPRRSRRYNTAGAERRQRRQGRPRSAAQTAVDWSEACDRGGPGLVPLR